MRTQPEIDSLLQQLIGHYAGQAVDYYGYGGECFSLNKRWYDVIRNGHLNGQMSAPPSADGWGSGWWSHVPGQVQELFNPEPYNPDATYPAGSMFVNTPSHHIGILVSNNPGHPTATVFEQNADPDGSAAHTAQRLKTRIDGVLVIRAAQPVTTAPGHPCSYSPEPAGTKAMLTALNPTHWYNLNAMTTDPAGLPVANILVGDTPFTVGGYATHIDGHIYAMQPADYQRALQGDYSTNNGIEVNDLKPVPPPPPKPPAPPVPVPKAEKYPLDVTVMYFDKADQAKRRENAKGTIDKGEYYLVGRDEQAVKLSKDNKTDIGWINTFDNKVEEPTVIPVGRVVAVPLPTEVPTLPIDPPPVPTYEPVDAPQPIPTTPVSISDMVSKPKPQYLPIRADRQPVRLTSTNSIEIPLTDLEGKWPKVMFPAHRTEDYSMYTIVNGHEYWLPDRTRLKGWMYGVSIEFLPNTPVPTTFDRNANGRSDIIDLFDNGISGFVDFSYKYLDGIKAAVTTSAPKITQAKQRISKAVDGFSKRK